jgi:hypothetical protein
MGILGVIIGDSLRYIRQVQKKSEVALLSSDDLNLKHYLDESLETYERGRNQMVSKDKS